MRARLRRWWLRLGHPSDPLERTLLREIELLRRQSQDSLATLDIEAITRAERLSQMLAASEELRASHRLKRLIRFMLWAAPVVIVASAMFHVPTAHVLLQATTRGIDLEVGMDHVNREWQISSDLAVHELIVESARKVKLTPNRAEMPQEPFPEVDGGFRLYSCPQTPTEGEIVVSGLRVPNRTRLSLSTTDKQQVKFVCEPGCELDAQITAGVCIVPSAAYSGNPYRATESGIVSFDAAPSRQDAVSHRINNFLVSPTDRALLGTFPVTEIEFKGVPTNDQVILSPIKQGTLQFPGMEKLERSLIPSENLTLRLRRGQILDLEHVSDSIHFTSEADATAIVIVPDGVNAMPTVLDVVRYRYGVGEVLGFLVYSMALLWAIFKNPKVEIGPEIGS